MKHIQTEQHTIPDTIELKPASRPRYNSGDLEDAVIAAARVSTKHNCPMYVFPTYYGIKVSPNQPGTEVQKYYKIEGRTVTLYELQLGGE